MKSRFRRNSICLAVVHDDVADYRGYRAYVYAPLEYYVVDWNDNPESTGYFISDMKGKIPGHFIEAERVFKLRGERRKAQAKAKEMNTAAKAEIDAYFDEAPALDD